MTQETLHPWQLSDVGDLVARACDAALPAQLCFPLGTCGEDRDAGLEGGVRDAIDHVLMEYLATAPREYGESSQAVADAIVRQWRANGLLPAFVIEVLEDNATFGERKAKEARDAHVPGQQLHA